MVAVLVVLAAAVLATGVGAAVAKKKPLKGKITADGSSTVGPYTTAAAGRSGTPARTSTTGVTSAQKNTYKALSRPLFIYAKQTSFKRAEVAAFIGYIFNNERGIASKARFVSLTDKQLKKARYQYRQTLKAVFRR